MERSRPARPLVILASAGLLLTVVVVVVAWQDGVVLALALGGILATLFAGTFPLIKLVPARGDKQGDSGGNPSGQARATGMKMSGQEADDGSPTGVTPQAVHLSWQLGEGAGLAWHRDLNDIEDILSAQISNPNAIMNVAERAGLNLATLDVNGSAATVWHGVLRAAWIMDRERTVCQVLHEANRIRPSMELGRIIATHCREK
jgi:hypothetical protein